MKTTNADPYGKPDAGRPHVLTVSLATCLALAASAGSVSVEVKDFVELDPVVTATFEAGAGKVEFEWATGESGPYEKFAEITPEAEATSCEFTNVYALVAQKRWYRAVIDSEPTAAVAFTRFRQLERDSRDQLHGLKLDYDSMTGNITPFNGNLTQTPDLTNPLGVNFKRQMHIVGVRILPKMTDRTSGKAIYAATQFADYSNHRVQIGTCTPCVDAWNFYWSSDTENTYQCVYYSPNNGSIKQMQIFGWTPEELENNRGNTEFSFTDFETTNHYPVITWNFELGATNVALQVGKSTSGNFTDLVRIENPTAMTFVYTNTAAKVGEKKFYRVKTVKNGEVYTSAARPFTRFRWLERDPEDFTKVRTGYTVIGDKKTFDNDLATYGTEGNSRRGINFGEQVFIAGCRFYPRSGQVGRMNNKPVYGYVDTASYNAGTGVKLSAQTYTTTLDWFWRECADLDNGYQYCQIVPDCGNCGEMQIYGWTAEDIENVGSSVMPTHILAVSGSTRGSADISWSGAHFINRYWLEYRRKGTQEWTESDVYVGGKYEQVTLTGLSNGENYEFRLRCLGEDLDVDYSPVAEAFIFRYDPGSGTGLNALLMGNCTLNATTASQRPFFERRVFAGIDVSTNILFAAEAHTNAPQALVCFRGRINVPVAGTYTLKVSAQSSDGVAMRLDGSSWFNKCSCGGFSSDSRALEAGEHAIEIDWLSLSALKECRLTWACEGIFAEETVPASELYPAADSALPKYEHEEFDFLLPTASGKIPTMTVGEDGKSFTLNGLDSSNWNRSSFTSISRLIYGGEFIFEFTVTAVGRNSLFIASPDSNDYQVGCFADTGWTRYVGSGSNNDASSSDRGAIMNGLAGWVNGAPYKMRWVRMPKNRLKMQVMCFSGTYANQWRTINDFSVTDKGHFDKPLLRVGATSYGSSSLSVRDFRLIVPGGLIRVR